MRFHVTTTIMPELKKLAEDNNIQLSEALRVGIGVILAERGDDRYTGSINIFRKIEKYQSALQNLNMELENLKK